MLHIGKLTTNLGPEDLLNPLPYNLSQCQDPSLLDAPLSEVVRTAEQIDHSSESLQRLFDPKRVRLTDVARRSIMAPLHVLDRISRWRIPDEPSQFLWLKGEYDPATDSANKVTTLVASFVEQVHKVGTPIISYFCKHSENGPKKATVAMLYALIRQTVELLPPESRATNDMSKERFQDLDGEANTWDAALALFHDLVGFFDSLNSIAFCVLEGLHWLDSKSTESLLQQLLKVFEGTSFKVLFATTGKSTVLLNTIRKNDQVDVSWYRNDGW